ncbi:hypothetical protein C8R42DRAFT_674377 [Lentinula raphanica]|nr:hypothetical protein C8R42DRAFT_674377 [Lentinula raphanica]
MNHFLRIVSIFFVSLQPFPRFFSFISQAHFLILNHHATLLLLPTSIVTAFECMSLLLTISVFL